MAELEADTVALMRKRVYDMAGILGNGVKARATRCAMPTSRYSAFCSDGRASN